MTDDRREPPPAGDERTTLTSFLDYHRATLERKCAGLTPDQLARRAVPPSTLSLLGLVRHMAEVENAWFARVGGRAPKRIFVTDDDRDADFNDVQPTEEAVSEAFAAWRAEIVSARETEAATELDSTFVHNRTGEEFSLRWVLVHMVEEYARHNGHADLLREAIDGMTGE